MKNVLRKLAENQKKSLKFLHKAQFKASEIFFSKDLNMSTFTLLLFILFLVKLVGLLTCSEASPTVFLCIMIIFLSVGWPLLKGQMVCSKAVLLLSNYEVSSGSSKRQTNSTQQSSSCALALQDG